jgi:hypothetical protein
MPEPARRGERELPRAGAQVHDGRTAVQPVCLECGQVLSRVGIPLLAIETRHEGRVKVLGSCVGKFVDHPGVRHKVIVLRGRNSFLREAEAEREAGKPGKPEAPPIPYNPFP